MSVKENADRKKKFRPFSFRMPHLLLCLKMNTVRKSYVFHEPPHSEVDQVKKNGLEKSEI